MFRFENFLVKNTFLFQVHLGFVGGQKVFHVALDILAEVFWPHSEVAPLHNSLVKVAIFGDAEIGHSFRESDEIDVKAQVAA